MASTNDTVQNIIPGLIVASVTPVHMAQVHGLHRNTGPEGDFWVIKSSPLITQTTRFYRVLCKLADCLTYCWRDAVSQWHPKGAEVIWYVLG